MDKISGSSWREQTDPLTGSTFFYNSNTLQSQWERPADLSVLGFSTGDDPGQSQPTTDMPSSQQLETAPGGVGWMAMTSTLLRAKRAWRALVDNSTGTTYYFDETTGVSQWEKPSEIDENGVSHSLDRVASTVEQHKSAESNGGTIKPHLVEDSVAAAVTTPNSTHIVETRLERRRGSEESSSVAGNATLTDKAAGNCGGDRDPGRQRAIPDALRIGVYSSKEHVLFTEGGSTPSRKDGTVTNVGESSQYGSAQPGSVRPGSAQGNLRQQNSGRGEQTNLLEYPATVFTAWRTPNSEESDGFEGCIESKDVEPESEVDHGRRVGAGGDVLTSSEVNTDSLSYLPSSRQEGGIGSAQLTMHEEEGEGEDKNEDKTAEHRMQGGSRDIQQVNRNMAGSGEGGRTSARDGALAMGDIFDLSDKRQVAAVGCENRRSSSPLRSTPRSDGEHQQNASPDDASVLSVESGSTLSTYTGGLDSLAQYVTGHSSTLDRGAILEPPITRAKYEDGADGDDNARTIDSSLEGKQSSPGGLTTSLAEKRSSEKTPRSVNEENQPTVMAQPVQSNSNSGIIFSAQTAGQEQSTISWSENREGAMKLVDESPAYPVDDNERIAPRVSSALDGAREGGRQAAMNTPVSTLPAGYFQSDHDKSVPQPSRRDTCTGSSNNTYTSTNEQQANTLPRKEEDAHRMGELSSETRRHHVDNPSAVAWPFLALQGDTGAVAINSEQLPRALHEAPSKGSKAINSIVDDVKGCDTISAATAAVRSQDPRKGTLHAVIPTTESSVVPPGMTAGVHSPAAPFISRYDPPPAAGMTTAVAGGTNGSYASESCAVEGSDPQHFDAVRDAAVFEAAVKLQANARGWAARQLCGRILARRETMARETREAQQRAATAIQSAARGHLARREQRKARETGSLSDQYHAGYTYVQARGAMADVSVVGAETPSVSFQSGQQKQRLMTTTVSVEGNDGEVKSRVASQALSAFRVDGSSGPGTRAPIDGTGGSIFESHIAVENSYSRNDGRRDNEDRPITTSERSQGVLQGEQRSHDSEQCAEGHDWMLNVEHGWITTMSRLETINEEEDSHTQQQDEYQFWNRENAEEGSSNKWIGNKKEAVLYTGVPTAGLTGVEHPAGAEDTCVEEDRAGDTDEAIEAYPKDCHDLSNSSEGVGTSSDLTSPDDTSESVDGRSQETSIVSDLGHQSDDNPHDIETEKGYVQHGAEVNHLEGRRDGMSEVDRDTTAPLETLENLRTNVAGQAEVVARLTMTATGTDASRCEATRIRYVKISKMRSTKRHTYRLSYQLHNQLVNIPVFV